MLGDLIPICSVLAIIFFLPPRPHFTLLYTLLGIKALWEIHARNLLFANH